MAIAIRAENLSKRFRLGKRGGAGRNLTEMLVGGARAVLCKLNSNEDAPGDFWALRDVSFEVPTGEVVGLIGHNGAGKSTLLKILSRIIEPTGGSAELRGRLGSLLEVGTGFHPELTGRENVYLSGSILGMKRAEIDRKFDEIVAFADIAAFIDTPVKRYSSGMYVRLAFAIAANLQPEILILDEVLAVGDAQFQKKCLGKMKDVSQAGRTVLFVSHDMAAIRKLCTRAIVLEKGRVIAEGPTAQVVADYLAKMGAIGKINVPIDVSEHPRFGSLESRFVQAIVYGADRGENARLMPNKPMHVELTIRSDIEQTADSLAVMLFDRAGTKLVNADSFRNGQGITLKPGENRCTLRIDPLPLAPGVYAMGLWLAKRPITVIDQIDQVCEIEIEPDPDDPRPSLSQDGVVNTRYELIHA